MLSKLFKLDFKWINRYLPYFAIGSLALAGLTRLFSLWVDNAPLFQIFYNIFNSLTISAVISLLIHVFSRTITRFKHNFFKDEAYLTHTLPIEKSTLWASKFLAAEASSLLAIALSVAALLLNPFTYDLFVPLISNFFQTDPVYTVLLFALLLLEFTFFRLSCFNGIILAFRKKSSRTFFAILFIICFQVGFALFSLALFFLLSRLFPDLTFLFEKNKLVSFSQVKTTLIAEILVYLAGIVTSYTLGRHLLQKGIDVE